MNKLLSILLLLVGLLTSFSTSAQENSSPYHLSLKREIVYLGSGILGNVTGQRLQKKLQPITFGQLKQPDFLDIDEFEIFDRQINFTPTPKSAARLSDLTKYASLALPTLLLGHKKTRRDVSTIGLLYLETLLINQALTDITKFTALRPRPYVWTGGFLPDRTLNSNDRASFFSGHTSGSAAASFFFARVFSDYFPDSRLKPYVWSVAATLPAVTGYLRIKGEKHYPTDVFLGYLVGGAVGYLIPTLHKRPLNERKLKVSTGLQSLNLSLKF